MKKVIYAIALTFAFTINANAQDLEASTDASVSLSKSGNNKPEKAKNDLGFRYYYYPNMQAYFDIENKVYIYKEKGIWNKAPELPPYYGGYSLFKNAMVKIEGYTGDHPEELINSHKKTFPYVAKGRFPYPTESSLP